MDVQEPQGTMSRETVLKLMDEKEKIESEIGSLMDVLSSNHVGMHEPLVDGDGYPRQDIDVYQVRHARHRICCLQNDHKRLMRDIEHGLHNLHSTQRLGGSNGDSAMETSDSSHSSGDPIAVVNDVTGGSPAADAGLEVSDHIIEFGSVNASNFRSLQDIAAVAQHSIGQPVSVLVRRQKRTFRITLTPKAWGGRGLLGCNILVAENVDR